MSNRMNRYYPQPVIIGTDLTGLLVSVSLSNAQVPHTLISSPSSTSAIRHGETTSMVGAVVMAKAFPELARYVYAKKFGIVRAGDLMAELDFSHPSIRPMKALLNHMLGIPFTYPLQIDRTAVDVALFEKATGEPYCTYIDADVEDLDFDADLDTIVHVVVADAGPVATSHVFDATGQPALVARKIGLERRELDEPFRVIQAYYGRNGAVSPTYTPDARWHDELNIIRLYKQEYGVNAIAICIPLGDQISVRVSAPCREMDANPDMSDEALLALGAAALRRHGIPVQDGFPSRLRCCAATDEQYIYARAYGANWLLTGMAYCNTLVTTAISADTSLEALYVGSGFLTKPAAIGAAYERYVAHFVEMQQTWGWLAHHERSSLTPADVRTHTDRYLGANNAQFLEALSLQNYDSPVRSGIEAVVKINSALAAMPSAHPYRSIRATKREVTP